MKRKIVSIALALLLLLSSVFLSSCEAFETPPDPDSGEFSRITVEPNCLIEILSDENGRTLAVSPLDDEAGVLLAGEDSFVGLTVEQAIERIINLAAETGYLIHGETGEKENTVRLSVSGNSSYSEELYESARKKVSGVMVSHGINGKVERVESIDTKALRDLIQANTLLIKEDLEGLSDEELYQALAQGRSETASLLTQDLRDAYLQAKKNEMARAEKEETAKIIASLGDEHKETLDSYTAALERYEAAAAAVEQYRYEMLVDPDSVYQAALALLRDKKAEILEQKALIATLGADSEALEEALSVLESKEGAYEDALRSLTALGESTATVIVGLIASLQGAELSLNSIESALDGDIKTALAENAEEIAAALNERSKSFSATFKAEYEVDIATAEESLKACKEALIAAKKSK